MSFTRSTVLGRRVLLDDWIGFHRDRLLSTLYDMRDAGGDENGLSTQQICDVSGLDRTRTNELLRLLNPKLVRLNIENKVVITERGVRWVEESPATRVAH